MIELEQDELAVTPESESVIEVKEGVGPEELVKEWPEILQVNVTSIIEEEAHFEKVEEDKEHEQPLEEDSKENQVVPDKECQEEGKAETNIIVIVETNKREDGESGGEEEDDQAKKVCQEEDEGQNENKKVEDENEENEIPLTKDDKVDMIILRKGSADLEADEDGDKSDNDENVKYNPIRKGSADLTGSFQLAWSDPLHRSILSQV